MKKTIFSIILLVHTIFIFAQNDYYIKDTLMSVGVNLIDGGVINNAKQCQVKLNKKIVTYSPDEVQEYGFKDGKIYLSRIIKINNVEKKVFLERLNKGKINLYYYKEKNIRKFFIEKDSEKQLFEIVEKGINHASYRDFLKPFIQDCDNVSDAIKLVTYSKSSFSEFIKMYNNCERKPFPFFKYGLTIGYSITELTNYENPDYMLSNAAFKKDKSMNFGLFVDIPLSFRYISFHPEVYYQKNGFSGSSSYKNITNDIVINISSINLPLLLRYTYPSLKLRPYINSGAIFSYNYKNESKIYKSTINDYIIELDQVNNRKLYSTEQYGYVIGGGLQYNLDYKKSIYLELRYNKFIANDIEIFNSKSISFLLGISF